MRNNRITLVLVALSFLLVAGFSMQAVAGETYKMGLSIAITGPTSDVGSPYSKGVEDYVKYVNDEKLLGDDKIECFIRDDGYKTEITKRNFEDFLDEEIVFHLNYSTGSTMALRQDFQEEKIPVLPASFHAGNLEGNDYIFLPIASYSSQAVGLAEYVAANHKGSGKPKIALFLHPSAFGRAPRDDVKKSIAAGLAIDLVEIVEHGKDLDNTAMLKRLKSKGVQYVISHTVQAYVAPMLKSAQGQGLIATSFGESGKITFLGAHYAGGPALIALAGSAAENYYWTTSYKLMTAKGKGTDEQLALAKRYGVPVIASTFASAAAVGTGLSQVARLNDEETRVVCWAGDGGTYDIGFATISAAAERNAKAAQRAAEATDPAPEDEGDFDIYQAFDSADDPEEEISFPEEGRGHPLREQAQPQSFRHSTGRMALRTHSPGGTASIGPPL